MYLREAHAESSLPALRQLIRDHPLGVFTTAVASPNFPLIQCTHIPFVLDVGDDSSETELGRLRGHMARQNPQAKAMIESLTSGSDVGNVLEQEVMVLFTRRFSTMLLPSSTSRPNRPPARSFQPGTTPPRRCMAAPPSTSTIRILKRMRS